MAARSAIFHGYRAGLAPAALLLGLAASGCSPDLSANTYNSAAVQQANKAEQGVVVGVRKVDVRVSGATGAVVGGAAGGIAGAQVGTGAASAFGALGGSLIGGLIGTGVEHAGGDTTAYEYVVRKANKELVSVTQKDDPPLAIGERVLVIGGSQARIVPDYTVSLPEKPEVAKESLRELGPVPPVAGGTPPATASQATPPQAPPAQATPAQEAPAKATQADAPPAGGAAAGTTPAPAASPPADAPPGGSAAPAQPADAAAPQAAPQPASMPAPVVTATPTVTPHATAAAVPATIPVPDPQSPGAPVNLAPTKLTPSTAAEKVVAPLTTH